MKILKILLITIILHNVYLTPIHADDFAKWLMSFKKDAISKGISKNTLDIALKDVKFLKNVIKYDRYQPEFYEDTKTYITKRTSSKKVKSGIKLYNLYPDKINKISNKFNLEKELLLSLMGIETNFGTYVGKMDIISSLATLSYDKRRSEFFTNELLTLLKLIDDKIIDYKTLYGSWAGAFGYFQFMPSTINNYAIDYDNNNAIELKSIDDSFASAANYLNKMGWEKDQPCFYKVNLKENIPTKYLNYSARNIKFKKKYKSYKKYIKNNEMLNIQDNAIVSIITPDKEIVENSDSLSPAYLIFSNYELILKWNRSLRFALAVCTLKNKFSNEL